MYSICSTAFHSINDIASGNASELLKHRFNVVSSLRLILISILAGAPLWARSFRDSEVRPNTP